MPSVLYLHGFASSPGSAKAAAFRERLAALGWPMVTPRLDGGDFFTLTLSRALARADEAAGGLEGPYVVVGSSMGGYVGLAHATRRRNRLLAERPKAAVVMAPALDFPTSFPRWMGAEAMARWAATGWTEVEHHETGRMERLSYDIVVDARAYAGVVLTPPCPVLIFHGRRDDVVPPELSIRFAEERPGVTLRLLDDDHSLLASLPAILEESVSFLGKFA